MSALYKPRILPRGSGQANGFNGCSVRTIDPEEKIAGEAFFRVDS